MATVPKRLLTKEEKADAQRLKAAWEAFRAENRGSTQDWLGEVTGLGGQSVIGQYLNGVIPLNHKALLSVCNVIGCDPVTISPALTAKIPSFGKPTEASIPQRPILTYVDMEEIKILTLYRESTQIGKNLIVDTAIVAEKAKSSPYIK